jgi:hypothetical protein
VTDLQLEALTHDVQGCKGLSSSMIPIRCQRLAVIYMRLECDPHDTVEIPTFTNLTWISLFKLEYTGDITPRLLLPNLTSICFEMAEHECSIPSDVAITSSSMICQNQVHIEDILREDGLLGPINRLQNVDIARLSLHEGRVNLEHAVPLTYRLRSYNLRSLRIEECTRLDTFIESLLGMMTEAKWDLFPELTELRIDNCESSHDLLSLRRSFADTRPELVITGSLRTPGSER